MTKTKEIPKRNLKNLDDLFLLNDGVNPLETTVPIIETQAHHKRIKVVQNFIHFFVPLPFVKH